MVMVPQVGTHSSSVDVGYMARSTWSRHRSIGCLISSFLGHGLKLEPTNWWLPAWLVVWNMAFIFPYIENVIIPTDFHIFQRGRLYHQPAALSDCLFHSTILGTIRQNQHGMHVDGESCGQAAGCVLKFRYPGTLLKQFNGWNVSFPVYV